MLCRTSWLRTKLWNAIWVWKFTFWSPTRIFPQIISAKSVTNTVKDFTKTFWLWKSGTKASGPQVCWQTIAGHWRGMYLKPNAGESHTSLYFRGILLPVSLVFEVLFCTNRVLCIFETLPDRKVLLSWPTEVRGPKKRLNFVVQCYLTHILNECKHTHTHTHTHTHAPYETSKAYSLWEMTVG